MKRMVSFFLTLLLVISVCQVQLFATSSREEMRGIWISTIYNLDYPSTKNNITTQKNEFIEKLDALQRIGINTVFVQVRPKADALYQSNINPWSEVLTGTPGKDPGYDPLAFMIEETHKRGMEFHAWLNPYRVTTTGTDITALASNSPARLNPSWLFTYNNALYYNPELEVVKQHIVDTVKEIAINYNVDGIHFDDYFYPSSYPLPAGETRDGAVANSRRATVNDMVSRVSSAIKEINSTYNKKITFGISPVGIWKNSTSDITGSATSGSEGYYSVYADARTWIQNGWVDYVAPQIYWKTGHAKADYETLVKWWANEVAGTNVKLYIGQGIYNDEVATQIDTQLGINQKYSSVKGSIHFSLRDLLNNRMSCKDKISKFYQANPVTGTGNSTNIGNSLNNNNQNNNPSNNDQGSKPNSPVNPNAVGKIGEVTAESLNIRAGARVDRDIITKIKKGTKVTILSILGDWYKVKLTNGTVGWANAAYINVTDKTPSAPSTKPAAFPMTGTVTATSLNVRSGARVDRAIVAKIKNGTKVTLLSSLGDWYKIKLSNGTVGWCVKTYIK